MKNNAGGWPSLVQAAVTHGARLETGGDAQGVFFRPAVLSGVSKNDPVFHEGVSARWLC